MLVYDRSRWGARPPKHVGPNLQRVPFGVVHHVGGGPAYPANVAATLNAIQANELAGAYVDIAYSIGVDAHGDIWLLRGGVSDGATLGFSGHSVSVLAICNASAPGFAPTPALIAGIDAAFRYAIEHSWLATQPLIDGHHAFDANITKSPTACAGELNAEIPRIRAGLGVTLKLDPPKTPPTAPPPPEKILLRSGARGPLVIDLQKKLGEWAWIVSAHGDPTGGALLNPGPADGIWGARTNAAVRAFQRRASLVLDGVVGPVTWAALHRL